MSNLENKYIHGLKFRGDLALKIESSSIAVRGKNGFSVEGLNAEEISAFENIKSGVDSSKLSEILSLPKVGRILELMDKGKMLQFFADDASIPLEISRQYEWLSYQTAEPLKVLERLSRTKVLILGCGGTGAVIAMQLIRSGILNFAIVDGAEIDAPDMNRQLPYFPEDVGSAKPVALKNYLERINPKAKVTTYGEYVESSERLVEIIKNEKVGLVINCADKPFGQIHNIVTTACLETSSPVIFGGVGQDDGTIGPLLHTNAAKENYIAEVKSETKVWENHREILKSSQCFTNSIISSMIGLAAFQYLVNPESCPLLDKSYDYNFSTFEKMNLHSW